MSFSHIFNFHGRSDVDPLKLERTISDLCLLSAFRCKNDTHCGLGRKCCPVKSRYHESCKLCIFVPWKISVVRKFCCTLCFRSKKYMLTFHCSFTLPFPLVCTTAPLRSRSFTLPLFCAYTPLRFFLLPLLYASALLHYRSKHRLYLLSIQRFICLVVEHSTVYLLSCKAIKRRCFVLIQRNDVNFYIYFTIFVDFNAAKNTHRDLIIISGKRQLWHFLIVSNMGLENQY